MATKAKRSPLREKALRLPGQSLDDMIKDKIADLAIWFFVPAGFIALAVSQWVTYYQEVPANPWIGTFLAGIIVIIAAVQVIRLQRQIANLQLGRDGERSVAEELQGMLSKRAAVLHDICGENFNIDHVIISPHGIFTIETKTYRKGDGNPTIRIEGEKILVDGYSYERDPIQQAKAQARWLHDLLLKSTGKAFSVKPVILFPGWFVEPVRDQTDIWVLNPKALPIFIANVPAYLNETDVHLATFHLSRYVRTLEGK